MIRISLLAVLALSCVMCTAAKTPEAPAVPQAKAAMKKVVFIAGGRSHGFGQHDHLAGCMLLAKRINEIPGLEAIVEKGWPRDETVLDDAAAIVIYCDGGPGHLALPHVRKLNQLSTRGVGIGCIHYAVEVPPEDFGKLWLRWMGGYFETNWSVNPHWRAAFTDLPVHPILSGVKPFALRDEWYYNMRFREEMKGVTPILSAVPPDETRKGEDDPHGGNPEVRKGIGKNQKEHVLWLSENENGSRGFGTTGGHFHFNWAHDGWRNIVLGSIVWIAKEEIPREGIRSERPSVEELLTNHDEPVPDDFDQEALAKKIEQMNEPIHTAPAKE